jgi:hypothetical protein
MMSPFGVKQSSLSSTQVQKMPTPQALLLLQHLSFLEVSQNDVYLQMNEKSKTKEGDASTRLGFKAFNICCTDLLNNELFVYCRSLGQRESTAGQRTW